MSHQEAWEEFFAQLLVIAAIVSAISAVGLVRLLVIAFDMFRMPDSRPSDASQVNRTMLVSTILIACGAAAFHFWWNAVRGGRY